MIIFIPRIAIKLLSRLNDTGKKPACMIVDHCGFTVIEKEGLLPNEDASIAEALKKYGEIWYPSSKSE